MADDKHRITAVDREGNKVGEPILINGKNPFAGGDSSGGAFVDEDGDGDAELQTQGADFQGGDAKNIGAVSADGIDNIAFVNGRDPISVVNNAGSNTTIIGDPTNQHTISSPVTLSSRGQTVAGLNLSVASGTDNAAIEVTADYCTVSSCIIDGNKANNTGDANGIEALASYANISNNEIKNCDRHNIYVNGQSGSMIEQIGIFDNVSYSPNRATLSIEGPDVRSVVASQNMLYDGGAGVVQIDDGASAIQFTDNTLQGSGGVGIQLTDHSTGQTSAGISLSNNTFYNLGNTIDENYGQNNIFGLNISDNVFHDCGGSSGVIYLHGNAGPMATSITGNSIYMNGKTGEGILVETTRGTISENGIVGSGGRGVHIKNSLWSASNNYIRNATSEGILLSLGTRVSITSNTAKGCDYGIRCENLNGTVDDYIVTSNITDGNTTSNISTPSGTNTIVNDNITT